MLRICYPVSHTYLKHELLPSTDLSLGYLHAVLTREGDGCGTMTSIFILLSVEHQELIKSPCASWNPNEASESLLISFMIPAIYLKGPAHFSSVLTPSFSSGYHIQDLRGSSDLLVVLLNSIRES